MYFFQSSYTIDFTNAPDIRKILGLEGCTVILPSSYYGSIVIPIIRNRQVIQVYFLMFRSPARYVDAHGLPEQLSAYHKYY